MMVSIEDMKNFRESAKLSGVDEYNFEDTDEIWDEKASEIHQMDRDGEKRREEFYSKGYYNGIFAGKDAGFEEGLNIGFKESALAGYKFGIVRGVSSALAFLPDNLRKKLIDEEETREKFQKLHSSLHVLASESAVKLFNESMTIKKKEGEKGVEEGTGLVSYVSELSSLLDRSPKIEVSQHRVERL